ncbi:MAG: ArsR/SmtB family transcription factor [Nanobdellota archaeon]
MTEQDNESHFEVLELEDASKLAKTLSSPTSKKIIDHLEMTENATASDLSKKLNIALSTTHYHLKALTKSGIIDDSSFHYSEKGKEVTHYALRDKAIIILPRKKSASTSLKKQLQSLAPGILTVAAIAGGSLIYKGMQKSTLKAASYDTAAPRMLEAAEAPLTASAPASTSAFSFQTLLTSPEFLIGLGCAVIFIVLSIIGMQLIKTSRRSNRGK